MNGVSTVFTKYHGNGNDFIIFDLVNEPDQRRYQIIRDEAKALCDRHHGIGGDGVIMVQKGDGQWRMTVINADGSLAQNCGNGLRVLARYLADAYALASPIMIKLGERTFHCEIIDEQVAVFMGDLSIVLEKQSPLSLVTRAARGHIGNDHIVFLLKHEVKDLELLLREVLQKYDDADDFNLGFLWSDDEGQFHVRVHERGAGWTKSCGTGAMVAAAFLAKCQGTLEAVVIHQHGGELSVSLRLIEDDIDRALFEVVQQGNAQEVFRGICQLPES